MLEHVTTTRSAITPAAIAPATITPARHLRPSDLGTILSVWAHPDDETFLAGAVMAEAAASGARVVCVTATAGERGTDDPVTWPPERLGRIRRRESAAAMAVLGVTDHRWMGLPDGGLAALDPAGPVSLLQSWIAEVAPDTVLTFGPDGVTGHPDHRAVGAWTTEAWRRTGGTARLLHAAVSEPHLERWATRYEDWGIYVGEARPVGVPVDELAIHHVVSGASLDQKMAALLAMPSQLDAAVEAIGLEDLRAETSVESFVAAEVR